MTITPTILIRGAAAAAVAAGLIFIGVNIGHPHMDATSIISTEVVVRNSLKVLMAALALVGITGMYVSQVRRNGLLGLIGYLVFAAGYVLLMIPPYIGAFVLPSIADSNSSFVNDVLALFNGNSPDGDLGLLTTVFQLQGFAYLLGGLVFGIALFRAGVLARWAAVLLAVSGLVSVLLAVMPDAFYRFLAFPNAIAMIALGYSLWSTTRMDTRATETPTDRIVVPAGAE